MQTDKLLRLIESIEYATAEIRGLLAIPLPEPTPTPDPVPEPTPAPPAPAPVPEPAPAPPAPAPEPSPVPTPAPMPVPPPAPEPAPEPPPPSPAPVPVPPPPVPSGLRYRPQHRLLFQGASWRTQPARIPGGASRTSDGAGPNALHVSTYAGWPWDRQGGDWIDADGVRHGPKAWATASSPNASVTTVVTLNVTAMVQHAQRADRWLAVKLWSARSARRIAARWHDDEAMRPTLRVVYDDGEEATLPLSVTAACSNSVPKLTADVLELPVLAEWERPTKPVRSAFLTLHVVGYSSGGADIGVYLLDPPVNADPWTPGVALQAGPLDEGITAAPGIIGAQRYVDGTSIADFAADEAINTWASREFDPGLWGGTPDRTKLPHKHLGKFVSPYKPHGLRLVASTHADDGFEPLAPGLGALRLHLPAMAKADGDVVGYGGTGAVNASIFMPEHLFGRLPRIFVRQYVRLGTPDGGPYRRDPKDRLQVYQKAGDPGSISWTDWGGKWGITPDHTSSYGGTSGSAGGGNGWQMRLAWSDCDGYVGGPDEGGIRAGFHLYDFGPAQPPGHSYAGETASRAYWGQRGGLGGVLYAHTWYCIETEVKLNTVMDEAPGFLADGELRAWVDGRLVYERAGMVFRSKPLKATVPTGPTVMPPVRNLGVRSLWLTWYHGGTTQESVDRVMFVTGLAYGTQYIGPMRIG